MRSENTVSANLAIRPVMAGCLLLLFGSLLPSSLVPPAHAMDFTRGDCNGDETVDLGDAIHTLGLLFSNQIAPCESACDSNDDSLVDIADSIALLAFLFSSGSPPPQPYPDCGVDPTGAGSLSCDVSTCSPDLTVVDADGNVYTTIVLGQQTWTVQNLKTTKFNDGTPIAEFVPGGNWNEGGVGNVPLYRWLDTSDLNDLYDSPLPFDFFGAAYNEAAIASGQLAPPGWRIPTVADFAELESFLAGDGHPGAEATVLRSTSGWSGGANGLDLYGFNALAGGYTTNLGTATGAGAICVWCTADVQPTMQTRTTVNLLPSEGSFLFADQSILLGTGLRLIME